MRSQAWWPRITAGGTRRTSLRVLTGSVAARASGWTCGRGVAAAVVGAGQRRAPSRSAGTGAAARRRRASRRAALEPARAQPAPRVAVSRKTGVRGRLLLDRDVGRERGRREDAGHGRGPPRLAARVAARDAVGAGEELRDRARAAGDPIGLQPPNGVQAAASSGGDEHAPTLRRTLKGFEVGLGSGAAVDRVAAVALGHDGRDAGAHADALRRVLALHLPRQLVQLVQQRALGERDEQLDVGQRASRTRRGSARAGPPGPRRLAALTSTASGWRKLSSRRRSSSSRSALLSTSIRGEVTA